MRYKTVTLKNVNLKYLRLRIKIGVAPQSQCERLVIDVAAVMICVNFSK